MPHDQGATGSREHAIDPQSRRVGIDCAFVGYSPKYRSWESWPFATEASAIANEMSLP
jgi:hypothetical protein